MRQMPFVLCGILVLGLAQAGRGDDTVDAKKEEVVKAYEELADILNSGVWTATVKNREKVGDEWVPTDEDVELVSEYRSIGGGKYLQMTRKKDGEEGNTVSIFGVDYNTNKLCWWTFGSRGNSVGIIKKLGDNKWTMDTQVTTDEGKDSVFTITLTWKKGKMQEGWSRTMDGVTEEIVGTPIIWTLRK